MLSCNLYEYKLPSDMILFFVTARGPSRSGCVDMQMSPPRNVQGLSQEQALFTRAKIYAFLRLVLFEVITNSIRPRLS